MKRSRRMQPGDGSVKEDQLNYQQHLNEQTRQTIPQLPVHMHKSRTVTQDYLTAPLHACLCRSKISILGLAEWAVHASDNMTHNGAPPLLDPFPPSHT